MSELRIGPCPACGTYGEDPDCEMCNGIKDQKPQAMSAPAPSFEQRAHDAIQQWAYEGGHTMHTVYDLVTVSRNQLAALLESVARERDALNREGEPR